jgi:hypothetical protein
MRLARFIFCTLLLITLQMKQIAWTQKMDSIQLIALPTKVPDSILGTVDYYAWREADFSTRIAASGLEYDTPHYYCNYGHKYAHRFTWHIRPHLSAEGQQWLDKTLLMLQIGTEVCLLQDPFIELAPERLYQQLFTLHPQVYEAAGFFELSFRDQLAVVIRLDPSDLTSPEGRRQVVALAKGYLRAKITAALIYN